MFRKRVLDVGKAGLKQIFAQQKRTNYNTNMSVVSGPPTVKVSKQTRVIYGLLIVCPPIIFDMICLSRLKYIAGTHEGYFR